MKEQAKKILGGPGKKKRKFTLPADHVPGIRVPKGGSMCKNCEYLDRDTMKDCKQKDFIKWNGSSLIPEPIDEYCSDWYEPEEELE
jgi:hypothetical protein